MKLPRRTGFLLWILPALLLAAQGASALQIFSAGMTLPESISKAPDGFGTHGGKYIVPDYQAEEIWAVSPDGSLEAIVSDAYVYEPLNGVFLPLGFGTHGGEFLVAGYGDDGSGLFSIKPISNGTTPFQTRRFTQSTDPWDHWFATPQIAPATFGTLGGTLFATGMIPNQATTNDPYDWINGVFSIDTDGNVSTFAQGFPSNPWGLTFAPADFGAIGGQMLAGVTIRDDVTRRPVRGEIYAIDPDGQVRKFTEIPILAGEGFMAQLNFSPAYFGDLGDLLFVSVAGRAGGGGTLGALLVVDAAGRIFQELKVGSAANKFDPRGVYFTGEGQVLVSDGSDPIWLASPEDFGPAAPRGVVPEPGTLLLLGTGLAGLAAAIRRRKQT